MTAISDRQQFAESGATIVSTLQDLLDNQDDNLPPDVRDAFATMRDWSIDLTARWVQMMQREEKDGDLDAMFWGHPDLIINCLRKRLSPGQLIQLARLLLDENAL
jgi:hypothetical protein